jgi:hypothetical protein
VSIDIINIAAKGQTQTPYRKIHTKMTNFDKISRLVYSNAYTTELCHFHMNLYNKFAS